MREVNHGSGAVDVAGLVLDRVLLALIVGELLYTLRSSRARMRATRLGG